MTMICRDGTNNNDFLRAECRSRAMVDKTRDNGNDLMVAEFGFLFLARAKWTSKTVNIIVKDKSTKIFHGLYAYQL